MLAQQRPIGVTVIAVISAILGILAMLLGLLLMLGGALFGGLAVSTGGPGAGIAGGLFAGIFGFFGFVFLIVGIVDIVFAYGAWTLKPWAWMLGIVIAAVSIVLALLSLGGDSAVTEVVTIALWAVVIYYLNTPPVKLAFGRP
jgi:hypothetical protein